MFVQAYRDITADDQGKERSNEREIISMTIARMVACDTNPNDGLARVKTIHFVKDVWTYFMNDLASSENAMPTELKASLFSLGIFVLKHLQRMRDETDAKFAPLIEISETIKKGLD
ncbi:MAG: flagellar biosynthesis regulator FlaF [Pseudomonadota bacterium]